MRTLLALAVALFANWAVSTSAHAAPLCNTLFAGQTINVGTVCVERVGDDLTVTYATTGDWFITQTHLWLGKVQGAYPSTNSGNPQFGHFPYGDESLYTQSVTYTVSLASLGVVTCPDQVFGLAHAVVTNATTGRTETAIGFGTYSLPGERWGWEFEFTVPCDEDLPGGQRVCETAFAFGNKTFIQLGLTSARWGWEIANVTQGSYRAPLYAGAGRNQINKAKLVGYFVYSYVGGVLNVRYEAAPGVGFDETHLYAGYDHVSTIAPGQFGNTQDDLANASLVTYSLQFNGAPLFLVGHAVACWRK